MQSTKLVLGVAIAEKSFFILIAVGVIEVFVGFLSRSVALIADGVHSFAGALVSLVVWIGLRFSRKAPDGKFHFGYYRFETFSSLVAAFFMAVLGGIIIYESYLVWITPREIVNAELAMIAALSATAISVLISIYMARAARKTGSLSLKTGALSEVTDLFSSMAAFIAIVLNRYFGILHMDSIAGIIIALFIFAVAYSITKEASLVLLDACECGDIVPDIESIAKNVEGVKEVHSIRMRKLGPYLVGDMHVVLDGEMSVRDANRISTQIEELVKKEFDVVTEIKVRIEPPETQKTEASKSSIKNP